MIGKVCACSKGIIGVVTEIHATKSGQHIYSGLAMSGKRWQSVNPVVIADSLAEYINDLVEKQIYAKMHCLRS